MLFPNNEEKLLFKCDCGSMEFTEHTTYNFKYSNRIKEYEKIQDEYYFKCIKCGKIFKKDQIK